MSSMINKVLIFLLIANEIRCQTQNSFEKKIKESSDNSIKIDVKQKYNVTLEGLNAALDEARWTHIVTSLVTITEPMVQGSVQDQS